MRNRLYRIVLFFPVTLFFILTAGAGMCSAQTVLTLEKALEVAMSKSTDIRRTRLDLERSQESLNAQRAALKSQFSFTVNPFGYRSDRQFNDMFSTYYSTETKESFGTFTISQPLLATDGTLKLINSFNWQDSYSEYKNITTKSYKNNMYLSYSQPIFTYNQTKLTLSGLERNLENTKFSFAIQKLNLERSVTQSFYNVYQAILNLDIAKDDLKNQEQSYQIIKNRVDAGISAQEELYQAELNLLSSRSSVQNSQVSLDNSLDDFKNLLGISLYDSIAVEADIAHKAVEVNLDKALNNGLKTRMELRQREISIQTAIDNLTRAAAQNEFKGSITLAYGLVGTDENFGDVYINPTNQQTIGLSLAIPIWDWGEKKSRIKASEASFKSQQLSLEDDRNSIIIAIRRAYRDLQNEVTQIEIANQNIQNAQRTYDLNLERYKNGDLTSMDLSLYQNQLTQKKTALTRALINYKLAILNMKILSLWDFVTDQPVLQEFE